MRLCLLFLSCLALACGGSRKLESGAGLDNRVSAERAGAGQDDLLAYVDADAMYVYASLERLPAGLAERGMRALDDAAEPLYELLDMAGESAFESPEERVLFALAAGLRDKLSVSGFRSIGIDLEQPFVLYSVGILPVVRLRLHAPAKFARFVEDTAARARIDIPRRRAGTTEYWAIPVGETLEVAMVMQGSHLVAILTPRRQPELTVERALGRSADSLARSNTLAELRERYQISMDMIGYIDVERTFGYLRDDADSFEVLQRQALFPAKPLEISPECVDELGTLASHVPRVVMGYRTLTAKASHAVSVIETSRALGAVLRQWVRPHPWLTERPTHQPLFAISMGIDQGAMIQALSDLSRRSWRCEALQQAAERLGTATAQFQMPPAGMLFGGITGLHVSVDDIVPLGSGAISILGYAIVEHEQPDSVAGLLGLLGVPTIRDNAPPVTLPLPLPLGTQTLSASRHGRTLVFSLGQGSHERALAANKGHAGTDAPVMTAAYDEARMYRLAEDIPWLYTLLDDRQNQATEDPDELARLRRIDAALASGFSYATMRFREQAIVIETVRPGDEP